VKPKKTSDLEILLLSCLPAAFIVWIASKYPWWDLTADIVAFVAIVLVITVVFKTLPDPHDDP